MLYELSTPFLSIHWFCDKLGMTGSKLQLYKGIALLITFFGCRIVWGTYSSVLIYLVIYKALTFPSNDPMASLLDNGKCDGNASILDAPGCEVGDLPTWLVSVYLIANTALSLLNLYCLIKWSRPYEKKSVPQGKGKMKKGQ